MFIIPEVILQKLIENGINKLRDNQAAFYEIFRCFTFEELQTDYGVSYIDQIWAWFSETDVPVIQAWSYNVQRVPCYSIKLANEQEDESKAAINDYYGTDGSAQFGVGVFRVNLNIDIIASKTVDHVLWMYYILSYILFKEKIFAEKMGLQLHTFGATDYVLNQQYNPDNVFVRTVRFACTVEQQWGGDDLVEIDDVITNIIKEHIEF